MRALERNVAARCFGLFAVAGSVLFGCGDKPSPAPSADKGGAQGSAPPTSASSIASGTAEGPKSAATPPSAGSATTPDAVAKNPAPQAPASAAASADAAPGEALGDLFKGDVPTGGTARPLFKSSAPSGVVVMVPKEMGEGSGIYGEGYTTTAEIDHKLLAHLTFEIDELSGEPKLPKLSETQLKQLCYQSGVDGVSWEPAADATLGPDATAAFVWRGKGTTASKLEWRAYAVSTVVAKNKWIKGCGAFDPAHHELEKAVVDVLKSVRLGQGAKTDPGNP